MTSKPSMDVALRLTGTGFSPEDVTALVRIVPTKTWRLGDSIQDTKLSRKHDGWVFGLPYRETYDMDTVLRELLDAIEPYRERINEATKRFGLKTELSFGVYVRDETPTSWFPADTIRRVAAFGASLEIDLVLIG